MHPVWSYLPQDRRAALAAHRDLPDPATGSVLFADLAGFTPLTETLTATLGPRHGIEALTDRINTVYDALITAVEQHGGSVIGFAGDSLTCWFAADDSASAPHAVACARAQQTIMDTPAGVAGDGTPSLALKVAVASGTVRRFCVGDPTLQVFEVLAGATLDRMAAAEHLAAPGEIVVDAATHAALPPAARRRTRWRIDAATGLRFAVLPSAGPPPGSAGAPPSTLPLPAPALAPAVARPWLPAPVYERLISGQGEFLTELRPAVACFLRFTGLDYDGDAAAGIRLDAYIRWVQQILARYDGTLLQLTIGDKGSYLYAAWGAPIAHEDDALRALLAAAELRAGPAAPLGIGPAQIGLSRGVMRAGPSGSTTRRTYAVLGDEVNLTARLMSAAAPGQILVSARVQAATAQAGQWESLPPLRIKGKRDPVAVYALQHLESAATSRFSPWQHDGPLYGRAAEQDTLARLLDRARAGQGQVISLVGDAGMGKSRLIAGIEHSAQATGWAVYSGAAQSFGTHVPYLAWRGIWQAFFDVPAAPAGIERDPAGAQITAQVAALNPALTMRVPLLAPLLDLPLPETALTAGLDERVRKESREALVISLLEAQTARAPLLLVLEDAQWLDPLSLDLLAAVSAACGPLPLVLLLAVRPPLAASLPATITTLPHFTVLPLAALPVAAATDLLTAQWAARRPADPLPAGVVETLVRQGQGNPFYLEELVAYLLDQAIDLHDPAAAAGVEWPESLQRLVLGRLDQLPAGPQGLLKRAAIIGPRFPVAWVAGLDPASSPAALEADLRLTTQAALTLQEHPPPDPVYSFTHIVTQEVAYQSLGAATRADLHGRLATWLEATPVPDVEELAFHYQRSPHIGKAQEYLRRAGEAAAAAYNNRAALDHYSALLARLPATDPARAAVYVARGEIYERQADWAAAATDYTAARADPGAPLPIRAAAARGLGVVQRRQREYEAARTWFGVARAEYAAAGNQVGEARVLAELGEAYRAQGAYAAAAEVLTEAATLAAQTDAPRVRALALSNRGNIAHAQGDLVSAEALWTESLAVRRAAGDQVGIAASLNNLGLLAYSQGQYGAARAYFDESLALHRALGNRQGIAHGLNNLGLVIYNEGDYAAAQALWQESLALLHVLGDRRGGAACLSNLGIVAYLQADYATAGTLYSESLALRRAMGDPEGVGISLRGLAQVAHAQGDPGQARAYLLECLEQIRPLGPGLVYMETLAVIAGMVAPVPAAELLGTLDTLLAAQQARLDIAEQQAARQAAQTAHTALGATAYAAAHATGQGRSWTAAVEVACRALGGSAVLSL